MPRSKRNSTRLSADVSAVKPETKKARITAGDEEDFAHSEDYTTQEALLTSPSRNTNLSEEQIEALINEMEPEYSHAHPDFTSIAVFPYLLEPDKTVNFSFSENNNKQFAKMVAYAPSRFTPKHKPENNWPEFIKDVWSYLQPYSVDGISPEQYRVMLQSHFPPLAWSHIYKFHVSKKPTQKARARACKTLLHMYTIRCYTFEARVRDYNKFVTPANSDEYLQSATTYVNLINKLMMKDKYKNYTVLLLSIRFIPLAELREFFFKHNCLNEFDSPKYEKITEEVITRAKYFRPLITMKNVCTND